MMPAENSVLSRELLRSGRSLRLFLLRGIVPLAIGALVVAFFLVRDPQAGIRSFAFVTFVFNLFALVAMPVLVSGVLYEEWHANTLSVLMLTETTLGEVLRGLLGSRVLLVISNLFACFPVLISLMTFGGITATQLIQFSFLMVSLCVLYGSVSLWVTCLVRGREKTLGILFTVLGAPQAVALYLVRFVDVPVDGPLSWVPSIAMYRLTLDALPWTGGSPAARGWGGHWLGLNVACLGIALVFFLLSYYRVGKALVAGRDSQGPSEVGMSARGRSRLPIRGNPLSWLVLKRFHPLFGLPSTLALATGVILVLGAELLGVYLQSYKETPRLICGFLGVAVMGWTFLWACLVAAQTWMEERTQRTLELILATPFTLEEIILWKVDALFWALVTPTVLYSFLLSAFVPVGGNPVLRLVVLVPATICSFLYSYVGLLVVVYVTIFFAIRAANTVQAVLLTFGSLGGVLAINAVALRLGAPGAFLFVFLLDGVVVFGFLPAFRRRLRSFEPV